MRACIRALAGVAVLAVVTSSGVPAAAAQAEAVRPTVPDAQLKMEIARQIRRLDYGAERPTVEVQDGVVMLSGTVATLWLKEETINRALKVPGIASLQSVMEIARAESDQKLAQVVSDRIRHYDLLGVFDDIQGRVKNGTVHLGGAVTEEKKLSDILERVAKVKGVQAIDNRITVLPESQADDRLRVAIANAIYRDEAFRNYSMAQPPIHVIVNNGHVTLTGIVASEIERRKAHEAASTMFGVLKLDDQIKLSRELRDER